MITYYTSVAKFKICHAYFNIGNLFSYFQTSKSLAWWIFTVLQWCRMVLLFKGGLEVALAGET